MTKGRICVLAGASLGGTEKAATIFAAQLAGRGYDVDYLAAPGPRSEFLKLNNVRVIDANKSVSDLYDYIAQRRPDVIHQHVPGYPVPNNLYPVLQRSHPRRPKIIETNIFGRFEDSLSEQFVDFRMFISMASAAQAFRRARIKDIRTQLDRNTVVYYPVAEPSLIDLDVREGFRRDLNIGADEILAVRVGRAGHKWASWECEAYAIARKRSPRLRLFLMEPPGWLAREIAAGRFGTGIIVQKECSDFAWLERLYASADLMIHASDWGESFGYTIAEGMAAGLPVITRSTPWCDNAQVELVKNRETGFVCWSVPELARRLVDFAENRGMRKNMGTAAKNRILRLASPSDELELLEDVILYCTTGSTIGRITSRNTALLRFIGSFARLERTTSDMWRDHPLDFSVATIYAYYRRLRATLGAFVRSWLQPAQ